MPKKKAKSGGKVKKPLFKKGQKVWPVMSRNGVEQYGCPGTVVATRGDGRVKVKFTYSREQDFNPERLSTKEP